jgi:hypothetical protein
MPSVSLPTHSDKSLECQYLQSKLSLSLTLNVELVAKMNMSFVVRIYAERKMVILSKRKPAYVCQFCLSRVKAGPAHHIVFRIPNIKKER